MSPQTAGQQKADLLPAEDHSHESVLSHMPKLVPRSAVAQRSASTSQTISSSPLDASPSNSEVEDEQDIAGSSRQGIPSKPCKSKGGRMTMLDFLAGEAPERTSFGLPSISTGRLSTSPMASNSDCDALHTEQDQKIQQDSSNTRSKRRKSLRIVPKPPTLDTSSVAPRLSVNSRTTGSKATNPYPRNTNLTAWEFLSVDPSEGGRRSPHSESGGSRISKVDVGPPQLKVKVMPVTDSIVMFGSTQTSSNYSMSGKVVLQSSYGRAQNRRVSQSTSELSIWHKDSSPDSSHQPTPRDGMSDAEDDARQAAGSENERTGENIRLHSLRITFSGFAHYVDHTGRFSALKLAQVTQDLLPQGASIACVAGASQSYEIEFNLSVPGWLPASMSTRFGGTFYCLQAELDYDGVESANKIAEGLFVPSRGASRSASPTPQSSSLKAQTSELDMFGSSGSPSNARGLNREESQKSNLNTSKRSDNTLLSSSPGSSGTRSSWLGKTAKHLQLRTTKLGTTSNPSSPSSSNTSYIPMQGGTDSQKSAIVERISASTSTQILDGVLTVSSKARTISISRCREVVPVPVARMAVIGPEGLPDGAHQDPPPAPRSSSVDIPPRSRRSTITTSGRCPSSPPLMPSAFNTPSDPSKLEAHASSQQPRTPLRASSATHSPEAHRSSRSNRSHSSNQGAVPMRHFLHRPMLHPPADAQISTDNSGLPFSLTLTLPSYVSVDGPGSEVLSFGVQIEVGKSSAWSKVRELGGLRLRDMELSCVQTERHSSVASRTFCNSYALPPEPKVTPQDLPVLEEKRSNLEGRAVPAAYDRALILDCMELVRQGRAPQPSEQNIERVRTSLVGPPPDHAGRKDDGVSGSRPDDSGKGKEREPPREGGQTKKDRRRSMPASNSATSALNASAQGGDGSAVGSASEGSFAATTSDKDDSAAAAESKRTGRGRRAYQSALRGLSNLATAVMDISLDLDNTGNGIMGEDDSGKPRKGDKEATQTAVYSFAGSDGNGVDLTRGRVRMAINLPLVTSDALIARSSGMPRLVADFESPYIRIRHKLKVRLGFGFGSKPLGGEGDGNWGQALVMCVPVRFTDAAPREVREQFAPLPVAQVASADPNMPSLPTVNMVGAHDAPILPSYNQLFREDGSRLADEGEDLPQYPGPGTRKTPRRMPSNGSVSGTSPRLGNRNMHSEVLSTPSDHQSPRSPGLSEGRFDNRIAPSRVVDESLPSGQMLDLYNRQQQLELEEIELEEQEMEEAQAADRLNETVNMDDIDDDEYGQRGAFPSLFSPDDHDQRAAHLNGLHLEHD